MALTDAENNAAPAQIDTQIPAQINVAHYRVKPNTRVHLDEWETHTTGSFEGDKHEGKALLSTLSKRLADLQEVFYAQGKHRLLIVLQAMDTGGKDSTISHVFEEVNPQGVKVASFKMPTPQELAHDYLWRIHPHTPGNGEMAIFNRSHYEDVLIVRVHQLVPKAVWKRRYKQINAFEKLLTDEGTTILKFFLHISKDEQKERLQARLDNPAKHWKFDVNDLAERERWDEYTVAYEEMLHRTSTSYAPWFIVPGDRKWYRNLVVAQTIVQTLEGLGLCYPEAEESLDGIVIE